MFRVRLVVALAAAVALVALGWTASSALQAMRERQVAVPPDGASPQAVVRAYVAALDGRDCETAAALVHPDLRQETASSCEEGHDHDDLSIREPIREKPRWSGHDPGQQVVDVPVKFGNEWWGYLLVRDSDRDPWRIFDQGVA